MQLSGIIQKARNNSFVQIREKGLVELRQTIEELKEMLPLVGRIITRSKHYGGRIERLEIKGKRFVYLKFSITDCDQRGKSFDSAKTYRKEVNLEELEDIQV